MAQRTNISFFKGDKYTEVLVSDETPLPVETKGSTSGVFVPLKHPSTGQTLEGQAPNTPTIAHSFLSNYTPTPNERYQTIWLVVFNPSNTPAAVTVDASLGTMTTQIRVAERLVPAKTLERIPIDNFFKNYNFVSGGIIGNAMYGSQPIFWALFGG